MLTQAMILKLSETTHKKDRKVGAGTCREEAFQWEKGVRESTGEI